MSAAAAAAAPSGVRWRTDFDKWVVTANAERRGWQLCSPEDEDWDVYWASVGSVKAIFSADSGVRLQTGQLINHFPNHYELTRKDLMVKNIKRYQKQVKREGGNVDALDFVPTTYVLPQASSPSNARVAMPPAYVLRLVVAMPTSHTSHTGLCTLCRGVQAQCGRCMDYEARQQVPGRWDLPHP
jgi:hypothetical protein